MKSLEVLFLKSALIIVGCIPIMIATLFTFALIQKPFNGDYGNIFYPLIAIIAVSIVPFLNAVWQGWVLLRLFDQKQIFSNPVIEALHAIRRDSFIVTGLYIVSLPLFYNLAQRDDAPGFVIIGAIFVFGSFVVAIFAQILAKIFTEAILLKQENELTV